MSHPSNVLRIRVSLPKPGSTPALISVVAAMTDNPVFPSPDPSLAAVDAAIDALDYAQVASMTRTRGTVAARNQKRQALDEVLDQLKAYVQRVADDDSETAARVIETAGMRVARYQPARKKTFSVRDDSVSGSVVLTAQRAAKEAAYHWQYSLDGGTTWLELTITLATKTRMAGLTPASRVLFRYRAITRRGMGDFCQPLEHRVG
jgi:hypothetical protein